MESPETQPEIVTKKCKRCSAPFQPTGLRQYVCPRCRREKKKRSLDAWRAANHQSIREYRQGYYQRHADSIRSAARARMALAYAEPERKGRILERNRRYRKGKNYRTGKTYFRRKQWVSQEELVELRQNPGSAIRQTEGVCLECGLRDLRRVSAHVKAAHSMGDEEYREKYGIAHTASLVSHDEKKLMARGWNKRRPFDPRICRPPRRSATRRRGPYRLEARLSRSRAIKGKAQPGNLKSGLTDEQLLRLHLFGKSNEAIARKYGLHRLSVAPRLRRLGVNGRLPYYFVGEPVTGRMLEVLLSAWGKKSMRALSRSLGMSIGSVARLSGKHQDRVVPCSLAKTVVAHIRNLARRDARTKIPPALHEVIRTQYEQLRSELNDLRSEAVRRAEVGETAIGGYVLAVQQRRLGRCRRLSLCPTFFIGPNWRIGAASTMVVDFLSVFYQVNPRTIERIVWPTTAAA